MFLPIGDMPNPRGFTPWVTWLLLATNVLVYVVFTLPLGFTPPDPSDPALSALLEQLAGRLPEGVTLERVVGQLSAWDLFVQEHGFKPGAPELSDLLVSMFLHANLAHLAGNMLFLWIYGDNVEHRLGRPAFLAAYLGTGVLATLAFSVIAGASTTPLVGASGAISGVLGLYFVLFPRNRVKVLVMLFPFLLDVWLVPAPVVLGLYVLIDNLLPLVIGASSGVAYGAHIGGFVGGLGLAWLVQRTGWRLASSRGRDPREIADELRHTPASGRRAELHVELGRALARQGHTSTAFQHAVRALELTHDAPTRQEALALLEDLPLDPALRARLMGSLSRR